MNYNAQPIKLSEVFGSHCQLFSVEIYRLSWLATPTDDYLLMLASKETAHAANLANELGPLRWKFSKAEVF